VPITEDFNIVDYSGYSIDQATTTESTMGRTAGSAVNTQYGLSTQRHIDVRTFGAEGAPGIVNENWVTSSGIPGTFTTGPLPSFNNFMGLHTFLQPGTTVFTSVTNKTLDLTRLDPGSQLSIVMPAFPFLDMDLTDSYLDLSSDGFQTWMSFEFDPATAPPTPPNPSVDFENALVQTWPFPLTNHSVGSSLPLLLNSSPVDLTSINGVRLRLTANSLCEFVAMALRLLDPAWVQMNVDLDNWNGCLRSCIPNTGSVSPPSQTLPTLWRAAPTSGVDDPQPVNGTFGVLFNAGAATQMNRFMLNLRSVQGVGTSQLALDPLMQVEMNGPQPGLTEVATLPRTMADLELSAMSGIDQHTMFDLETIHEQVNTSWLSFVLSWDPTMTIQIINSVYPDAGYEWATNTPLLNPDTYYYALISLDETQARIQIYSADPSTFAIGSLIFDSGIVSDSYLLVRRPGRVGWSAALADGDASIRSIRPTELVFAEYRSTALNSNTPVQGARLYAQSTADQQLWNSFTAVPGYGGATPTVSLDTDRTITGQSYKIAITQSTGFSTIAQGIISNVLTPSNDSVSGIIDMSHFDLRFSVWFPSAAKATSGGLSVYLLSEDGNYVPLSVPMFGTDHWQQMTFYPPSPLPAGRYQLGITYTGTIPTTFWIDTVEVFEDALTWSARANPTDPWVDFRDLVNSDSSGVVLNRGTALQLRAQAHRQDAIIVGPPKLVPQYARFGRFAWPEDRVADPSTPVANITWTNVGNIFSFNGTGSTPPNDLVNYLWSFGDDTNASGPTVVHTYLETNTYVVTLTVVDSYGTRNIATQLVQSVIPTLSLSVADSTTTSEMVYSGIAIQVHEGINVVIS
jgi:hypothetical protein